MDRVPASRRAVGAGPRLATIVVITPMATLVTNSASTRPLTARKPAFGLSARRRAAISVAGRLARRAMQPGADHGQPRAGDDQAGHDQQQPGQERRGLAVGRVGPAGR